MIYQTLIKFISGIILITTLMKLIKILMLPIRLKKREIIDREVAFIGKSIHAANTISLNGSSKLMTLTK